jgi:hypothetical protein
LILLVVFTLAACGPARLEETQQPLPTASSDWTSIKFTQSGGIMGMSRTIEILRDGSWKFTNERADTSVNGKLTAAELDQLNELILSLSVETSGQSGVCADCFIYSVEILSSGKTISAEADDVNLDESGLGLLVDFMTTLMSKVSAQ